MGNIGDPCSAEIHLELQMIKRVSPTSHFRIDECAVGTRTDAGDVSVIVDEARLIDVVESAFDQIGGFRTNPVLQVFRLVLKRTANEMHQTHKLKFRVSSFKLGVRSRNVPEDSDYKTRNTELELGTRKNLSSEHCASHRCHQTSFHPLNSKHVSAHNGQGLSRLDYLCPRQKPFALRRAQEIHFELHAQDARTRRHETEGSVAGCRISDRCDDAGVEKTILLR